jgi:hypothetical protein
VVASLLLHIRLGTGVWYTRSAEVTDSLTGVLWSTEEHTVGTSWATQSELIEGDDLTASLQDASASGLSDTKSTQSKLWDLVQTGIVGDGTNNDSDLTVLSVHVTSKTRYRQRSTVGTGLEETLEDDLVEFRVGTASKEAVQLHKECKVHIVGLWSATDVLLDTATSNQINTL